MNVSLTYQLYQQIVYIFSKSKSSLQSELQLLSRSLLRIRFFQECNKFRQFRFEFFIVVCHQFYDYVFSCSSRRISNTIYNIIPKSNSTGHDIAIILLKQALNTSLAHSISSDLQNLQNMVNSDLSYIKKGIQTSGLDKPIWPYTIHRLP